MSERNITSDDLGRPVHILRIDACGVPENKIPSLMSDLREIAKERALPVPSASQSSSLYAGIDLYQKAAIRTRSSIYTPNLMSLNHLEHMMANAIAIGRIARRLKRAAFGGKTDGEWTETPTPYPGCDPSRLPPQVLHSLLGILNEAGELAEMLHGVLCDGKPFDKTNYIEEKGDTAWFLFCDCDEVGIPASVILERNLAKLAARYPEMFDPSKLDDEGRDKAAETAAIEGVTSTADLPLWKTTYRGDDDSVNENLVCAVDHAHAIAKTRARFGVPDRTDITAVPWQSVPRR